MNRTYLSGNTYPFRDQIRAAGGRWDKERRQWHVPREAAAAMRALAAKAKQQGARTSVRNQPPDEDQRIVAEGTLGPGEPPVWIAWMGRVPKTGVLMARLITRDGHRAFWKPSKELRVLRRFETPLPLAGLLAQIESA